MFVLRDMKSQVVFVLGCFLMMVFPAFADVNTVSGTFENNQSVTISGVGFGTNALDYSQIIQAVNGTNDGVVPANIDGWRFDTPQGAYPIADTAQSHSGGVSLYHDGQPASGYNSVLAYDYGSGIGLNQTIFVSWWTRLNISTSGQWKMFRINWQNDIQDDAPQMTMFNWIGVGGKQLINRPGPTTSSTGTDNYMNQVMSSVLNTWYRHDLIIELSSSDGVSDGSYTMYRYEPGVGFYSSIETGKMTHNDDPQYWRWFLWQNYLGNGMLGEAWTDDHFVQIGSQARVELCDSSSWGARTSCDIQIPLTWSDNSISISVNTGAYSAGDTAYLYVVDSSGNVNTTGYPIVVAEGGGSSDEAPVTIEPSPELRIGD